MSKVIEVIGDITNFDETQVIAHQCNCLSDGSVAGVARVIFDKFPWSDIYKERLEKHDYKKLPEGNRPGDIILRNANGKAHDFSRGMKVSCKKNEK